MLAPWVLLAYSLIAFVSILKFVCVGKKLAKHDMAQKAGLGAALLADAQADDMMDEKELEELGVSGGGDQTIDVNVGATGGQTRVRFAGYSEAFDPASRLL
uniref:Uncharacterized protein n=1 Tax=Lotharella oceanica TaxID=641309 RepID=A0A7S2XHB5_9EUKA